jgi:ferredoxin
MTESHTPHLAATVSHDRCVGIGMCVQSCPGGFDFDDAGLSVFQQQGHWTAEELTEAAHSCPTSAIDVYRDGNRLP